jgi:histidinol-phosphate aminotransferase
MSQDERTTPRPLIEAAGGYSVPRASTPVDLHLDANEGAPAPGRIASVALQPNDLRRYPSTAALEQELADWLNVEASEVVVTAGGDDAIDRLCRGFIGPGRNLVLPTPSFVMIARSAQLAGGEVREVEWETPEFPLSEFMESVDAQTGVVAVVSPNNPTGFVVSASAIRKLSEAAPHALILLDLAYVEFADEDLTRLSVDLPNVVVVRTFSKARGLAGLRVGYAVGRAEWVGVLRAAGGPYPVSAASVAIARKSLEVGEEGVAAAVNAVKANREQLARVLDEVGFPAPQSHGNFLLAEVGDGARFRDAMAGMGIAVRAWPGDARLGSRSRITTPADNDDLARVDHAIRVVAQPEAIIFDVDGVLCDVRGSYRAAIVATCAHFGVDVGQDHIAAMKAKGDANNDWIVSQRLMAEAGVDVALEEVTDVFEGFYQGTDDTEGLWREEETLVTREWLESLGRRHRLALVTGRPRRDARRFVETSGFENLFGAVVCMEDAARKPSPDPLFLAMKQLDVQTAWFLGDTVDDIRSARDARVLPIGVVAPGEDPGVVGPVLVRAGAGVVWQKATDIERWLA